MWWFSFIKFPVKAVVSTAKFMIHPIESANKLYEYFLETLKINNFIEGNYSALFSDKEKEEYILKVDVCFF